MGASSRRVSWLLACTLAGALLSPRLAGAEEITLRTGKVYEGKIFAESEKELTLETPKYGRVTVGKEIVSEIKRTASPQDEYAAKKAALEPGGDAAELALARWCRHKGLRTEARRHVKSVLDRDPGNVGGSRLALDVGLVKTPEGRWVDKETHHRSLGMVRQGDAWVTPEKAERDRRVSRELGRRLTEELKEENARLAENAARLAEENARRKAEREEAYRQWRAMAGGPSGVIRVGVTPLTTAERKGRDGRNGSGANLSRLLGELRSLPANAAQVPTGAVTPPPFMRTPPPTTPPPEPIPPEPIPPEPPGG